jgi:hypothetical protein
MKEGKVTDLSLSFKFGPVASSILRSIPLANEILEK